MAGNEIQGTYHREMYWFAGRWHVADAFKRAALVSVLIAAVVALLGLVIVSPLGLRQLSSLWGANWTQLSNIGQTYGAASALLTGLALIGVAGSMVFQIRAIYVSREQSIREQHTHLIEMALADPVYLRSWGSDTGVYGSSDTRQQVYVNLIVSFWQYEYTLGAFQEYAMRANFESLFRGEAGRKFWATTRNIRLRTAQNRRDRRFCHLMEEEYQKAITAGPPTVPAEEPPLTIPASQRLMLRDPAIKSGATLLLGAIGGIAFKTFLRQWRR